MRSNAKKSRLTNAGGLAAFPVYTRSWPASERYSSRSYTLEQLIGTIEGDASGSGGQQEPAVIVAVQLRIGGSLTAQVTDRVGQAPPTLPYTHTHTHTLHSPTHTNTHKHTHTHRTCVRALFHTLPFCNMCGCGWRVGGVRSEEAVICLFLELAKRRSIEAKEHT